MKIIILFIVVLLAVGVCGCTGDGDDAPIGGETDEHGCLVSAGYTWCEAKQKCLRTWEEPCPGMVSSFAECEALGYPVMESYPRQCRTPEGETFTEDIDEPVHDDPLQGQAVEIAEEYVMNMKPYVEENGRNLNVKMLVQMKCPGCWQVVLQYDADPGKATDDYTNDRITVNVTLNNWEIVNVVSGRGGVIVLSPEECDSKGGRVVNTLGETCASDETNAGEVEGLMCPCICCVASTESDKLTLDEAIGIAEGSECTEKGVLTDSYMYNEYTKTWWIDLDMKEEFEKEYCNPACVVNEDTRSAEINWRCTGALPPE